MLKRFTRLAETAATNCSISRRGFLGWVGRRGLVLTSVVGGILVSLKTAKAGFDPEFACTFNVSCENLTERDCLERGGTWHPNILCEDIPPPS